MEQEPYLDEKYELMLSEPVEKLVCRFAGPSIVIMLITAFYNMADTYFVASIGTSATGAVGIVFSLMALIQAMGFFFGHGSGNYISRQLGAHNTDEAAKMAATGFFSALIAGTVVLVLGFLFINPLILLLGATPTILPYARQYMSFVLLGTPFMAGSLMLNNLLRFQGSTFHGMIGMTTGAVLNIILDPVFIFLFRMGVAGAGLATGLSQMVSCFILFYFCNVKKDNISIRFREFTPKAHFFKEMVRGGLPSLFRQGIASISIILLNHGAGNYGDASIAAFSIVNRVSQFAGSALIGFGQGFQPVCGFNYGAKQYDRVEKAFWFCFKFSTIVLLLLSVVGVFMAPAIMGLFQSEDMAVTLIGAKALRLQCITFPLLGWTILGNMMLQTIGKAAKASVLAGARQGFFLIPCLLIFPAVFGLFGLQICQPVSDGLTALLGIPLVFETFREMKEAGRVRNKVQHV